MVPQHRERIFIAGFRKKTSFDFPEMKNGKANLSKILEAKPEDKYTLTDGVWNALKRHAARHKKLNHGFGYGLVDINDRNAITRTLSARYYKDGAEILIPQKKKILEGSRPLNAQGSWDFPRTTRFPCPTTRHTDSSETPWWFRLYPRLRSRW